MDRDSDLIRAFEGASLAPQEWTHREHLRVAVIYLQAHPFSRAISKLRAGIQAINRTHGIHESVTTGYHETLTVAWAHVISAALHDGGPFAASEQLLVARPDLLGKTLLRTYYSRGRMLSSGAKARFVEPDLAALPPHPEHPPGSEA